MRLLFGLSYLFLFNVSCEHKENTNLVPRPFTTFEMSYNKDFDENFSILIDSNKIYFSPLGFKKVYYGILPDSIFNLIEKTYLDIRKDSTIESSEVNCDGCLSVAIKVVANRDTIQIRQSDPVNKEFLLLTQVLGEFINNSGHQTINSQFYNDTRSAVVPMPPSFIEDKVKHSKVRKKSGR